MILHLLACGGDDAAESGGETFDHFAGAIGVHYDFRATDVEEEEDGEDEGVLLSVDAGEEAWTVTRGDDVDEVETTRDGGFSLGDTLVLPERIESVTEVEVFYGTFPSVAEVTVDDGDWAGEQAFAQDVGPIFLTLEGESWALIYYE